MIHPIHCIKKKLWRPFERRFATIDQRQSNIEQSIEAIEHLLAINSANNEVIDEKLDDIINKLKCITNEFQHGLERKQQ